MKNSKTVKTADSLTLSKAKNSWSRTSAFKQEPNHNLYSIQRELIYEFRESLTREEETLPLCLLDEQFGNFAYDMLEGRLDAGIPELEVYDYYNAITNFINHVTSLEGCSNILPETKEYLEDFYAEFMNNHYKL